MCRHDKCVPKSCHVAVWAGDQRLAMAVAVRERDDMAGRLAAAEARLQKAASNQPPALPPASATPLQLLGAPPAGQQEAERDTDAAPQQQVLRMAASTAEAAGPSVQAVTAAVAAATPLATAVSEPATQHLQQSWPPLPAPQPQLLLDPAPASVPGRQLIEAGQPPAQQSSAVSLADAASQPGMPPELAALLAQLAPLAAVAPQLLRLVPGATPGGLADGSHMNSDAPLSCVCSGKQTPVHAASLSC